MARSFDKLWKTIEEILDLYETTERQNYFNNSGYVLT